MVFCSVCERDLLDSDFSVSQRNRRRKGKSGRCLFCKKFDTFVRAETKLFQERCFERLVLAGGGKFPPDVIVPSAVPGMPPVRMGILPEPGFCAYCGRFGELTEDHVIPRVRGGSWTVPCCPWCNASKGDRSLVDWVDSRSAAAEAGRPRGDRVKTKPSGV